MTDATSDRSLIARTPDRVSPRFRITTRRLMIAVAGVGVLFWLVRGFGRFVEELGEPYGASATVTRTFDLGPTPTILVDTFAGGIEVYPSQSGETTAEVVTHALADTTGDAKEALKTIAVTFNHQGDTLRIASRWTGGIGSNYSAHVFLFVPAGTELALRTGFGEIDVGAEYYKATPVSQPVIARSIRACNDSEYYMADRPGRIKINAHAPDSVGTVSEPIRLQLTAPGPIAIRSPLATVEARSWHADLPEYWTRDSYEAQVGEGTITFDGALAPGPHSLRAAHRVEVILRNQTGLHLDAEAVRGDVAGTAFPSPIKPANGRARWSGDLGEDGAATLRLRTDDGPIRVDRRP